MAGRLPSVHRDEALPYIAWATLEHVQEKLQSINRLHSMMPRGTVAQEETSLGLR